MVKQPTGSQKAQAYRKAEETVEKAVGRNPTLATMSNYFLTLIPVRGVPKVRADVMKAIESDIQGIIKKHTEPEPARKEMLGMLETALKTPEYVKLLEAVDLGEEHAKIMINEAVEKRWPAAAPVLTIVPEPTVWEKLLAQLKELFSKGIKALKEAK